MSLQRADILLVELGHASNRSHAQRLIKGGQVASDEKGSFKPLTKPGHKLPSTVNFEVTYQEIDRYASRGALKLKGALDALSLDVSGFKALDIGQSTGGFSDFLIQHGAELVVGIEVGHDQLAEHLRSDPRVICYEGTNARELPAQQLLSHAEGGYDLAVMDVSFISQQKILPGLIALLRPGGHLISLVKPQFEVGPQAVGKGGIVKDPAAVAQVGERIRGQVQSLNMQLEHYIPSPIKGGDGNQEFLLCASALPAKPL